jgi:hypothetical protein
MSFEPTWDVTKTKAWLEEWVGRLFWDSITWENTSQTLPSGFPFWEMKYFHSVPNFWDMFLWSKPCPNWVLFKLLERFWRIDLILDNTIKKPLLSLWWFFILEIFLRYFGIFFQIFKNIIMLNFVLIFFKSFYKSFYDFKTLVNYNVLKLIFHIFNSLD